MKQCPSKINLLTLTLSAPFIAIPFPLPSLCMRILPTLRYLFQMTNNWFYFLHWMRVFCVMQCLFKPSRGKCLHISLPLHVHPSTLRLFEGSISKCTGPGNPDWSLDIINKTVKRHKDTHTTTHVQEHTHSLKDNSVTSQTKVTALYDQDK